jgi:hypothetical protein
VNRKRVILGALLGVLAVCLMYAYLATPRLEKAPPRVTSPRQQQPVQRALEGEEKKPQGRIDFAYLASGPQEFAGAQRDIFRFDQRRTVKTAPTPPVVQMQDSPTPATSPLEAPEIVPMAVVKRSLSQFTFLGFLEKGGEKTVFLSSGGNLFLAKKGERFGVGQEFLVAEIDDKLLKVRHSAREGLIEIQLIEQQKLNAAVSAPVSTSRTAGPAGPAVKARAMRPQPRSVRPVARQGNQDFPGGVRQEDLDFPDDIQQEDQVLHGDDNSWPAKRR